MDLSRQTTPESVGKRIARLRSEHGWTQQSLSQRLAVSRVAISHIEMDLITPSERTVTLLAGIFKITPHELVDGTTYPLAKAEKLPLTTCSYTAFELELALLENDLGWLESLKKTAGWAEHANQVRERWQERLARWSNSDLDPAERELLQKALQGFQSACAPRGVR